MCESLQAAAARIEALATARTTEQSHKTLLDGSVTMEYSCLLFTAALLTTYQPGWAGPVISPRGPYLVVSINTPLKLSCHGDRPRWSREDGPRLKQTCVEKEGNICTLLIHKALPQHTGRFICRSDTTGEHSAIYVFAKDPQNLFKKVMVHDILVKVGENSTIPCLVTDPAVAELGLETCDGHALPEGLSYRGSLEHGVIISHTQKAFEGCYACTGRLGGNPVRSDDFTLTVRLAPEGLPVVTLNATDTILTAGQSITVLCSTTNVNNDFSLSWISPRGEQLKLETGTQILPDPILYVKSMFLHIASVRVEDSGTYLCKVNNERGTSSATTHLDIRERGFINLTEVENSTIQVRAGETLSLQVELQAYPPPHTLLWSYMGHALQNTSDHIITSQQLNYRYTSELKLVRLKASEGGVYTFSTTNTDDSANHTFAVHVISKPLIISREGPVDGQVRCVAEGYPTPEISWYYCDQPHTRCSHLLNATQEQAVSTVMVSSPEFGRREVESRVNISRSSFATLECVATAEGQQAYTLFSIRERTVPHQLFRPLLIGFASAAVVLAVILVLLLYKYLQKPKYQIQWKVIEGIHGNNYVYIDPTQLPYDHQWEFPRDKLRFGKTLGSGAFGKVVEATAYGMSKADTVMTVAVKMLKPSAHATEKEALMSELKVLSYLGHHMNIVNLLGACTVGGPTLVITEYCCFGDLLNFVRRKRDVFLCSKLGEDRYYKNIVQQPEGTRDDDPNGYMTMKPSVSSNQGYPADETRSSRKGGGVCGDRYIVSEAPEEDVMSLDTEDLLSFSYQVAKGMDFLASKIDLAARNVLLTQGRVAKICDFGLARDITTDSNYVVKGNARLPVKWMSPESIFECVYTLESDVWSYGILLWEIFSLGISPYPGIPVDSTFYKMIKEGYRMNQPELAPSEMFHIMKSCWEAEPLRRPSFGKIVEQIELQLSDNTKHIYLNFSGRPAARDQQYAHLPRLSSVASSTASTRPLLAGDDVFQDDPHQHLPV
ncbi:hypothetical protein AGOR_G00171470 [Albula goreensis]|uniref:receptor protein-tyrosine kinase n=1 Tax=Albula goreensis TaxID=1534307 RepID=A0A8T3CZA0_9TELE|nr:hypothetical protein AGOR_G00171470 [Albula goreensis]